MSTKEVAAFKEKSKKEAERIVSEIFPQKVLELDELLRTEPFSIKRITKISTDLNIPVPDPVCLLPDGGNTKKRKLEAVANNLNLDVPGSKVMCLPNGPCPSNKHILELINTLKPQIIELMEHANKIKMWISYLIPRIEDGNNFGVSIQEDTLAEARQVESEAATFVEQISRYFMHRGKLISKVAKYPHVDDYRRAVQELDEKEFITLRLTCCELRNQYAGLHDVLTKNLEKIRKPRSQNNHDSMY